MLKRPRIIPVLLIDDGDLVKTKRFADPVYLGDPVNAVKIFNIKNVDEMVDISASKFGKEPDCELLEDIASQAFMPLSYGGGITSAEQALRLLSIGYEKVILNTALYEKPQLIEDISLRVGSQSVVASIDAFKQGNGYKCAISDGAKVIDVSPVELAKRAESLGAGEILINSIDQDGMMQGYDEELIKQITSAVSVPVVACGGAGSLSDFKRALDDCNAHAVAAGSFFVFYGKLRAVLITFPYEEDLVAAGIYSADQL